MKKALTGAKLFTGENFLENKALLIEDKNIAGIVGESDIPEDFKIQKLNGGMLSPGFIDLHCHGGGGFDTMQGRDAIKSMSKYHLKNGTTSLLATTWTSTFDKTIDSLKDFNSMINEKSNLLGVHLEGPFINPNKLGAQPPLTQIPSKDFINKDSTIFGSKA